MLGLGDFQPKARESREVRTESTVSRSGDLNTFAISLSYDAHWRLRKKILSLAGHGGTYL